MTALAVVLACAALAFAIDARQRAIRGARLAELDRLVDDALLARLADHGQALQDVRAELARMEER